jgi:hypothetical protein
MFYRELVVVYGRPCRTPQPESKTVTLIHVAAIRPDPEVRPVEL